MSVRGMALGKQKNWSHTIAVVHMQEWVGSNIVAQVMAFADQCGKEEQTCLHNTRHRNVRKIKHNAAQCVRLRNCSLHDLLFLCSVFKGEQCLEMPHVPIDFLRRLPPSKHEDGDTKRIPRHFCHLGLALPVLSWASVPPQIYTRRPVPRIHTRPFVPQHSTCVQANLHHFPKSLSLRRWLIIRLALHVTSAWCVQIPLRAKYDNVTVCLPGVLRTRSIRLGEVFAKESIQWETPHRLEVPWQEATIVSSIANCNFSCTIAKSTSTLGSTSNKAL